MDIVIGTTTAPYKATSGEDLQWLADAENMIEQTLAHPDVNRVYVFAALEVDGRGLSVYADLLERLRELEGISQNVEAGTWTFSIDDGDDEVHGGNRLFRICAGRNLVHEYAQRRREVSHIMFIDSDLKVPADSIVKLLEVGKPLAGGDVPAYCLGGPQAPEFDFPVQIHWNTAGYLLVNREIFRKVRWRTDHYDIGATDDPCFAGDVGVHGLGPTYVRKDIIGIHGPLVSMEDRGHDRRLRKAGEQ